MSLSQRLLVADSHRQTREEAAGRIEASGDSGTSGSRNRGEDRSDASIGSERSGSEASSRAPRPSRRVHRRVCFDQIGCHPTIYHPGRIFEELSPLPPDLLRDPRAQSWGNVFCSCSSHKTVKDLQRENGGAGVTYIIPSTEQRPWSPPLVTSYTFRRDIAVSQLLNWSLRIAVMLMVMAAEIDISMSVRVFEELTFTKAEPNMIFSVKMHANYNVLTGHQIRTQDWQHSYFYIKSDEHAFKEPLGDDYRVLWNKELVPHLNTIAYPEKFFESAQAIATHSHLRWPDLSREWIRRQQARTARGGGASEERASSLVDEGVGAEPSALSPRKKKKSKKLKRKATDAAPLEIAASLDEASEGLEARKKKGGRKRPREGATSSIDQDEAPAGGREGAAEDLVETDPAEAVPEDRPKKT
ncbi:PREDICTED: uncharacterized protein LOC106336564 [Brassica oleracea var. oleracea]|uniref:uncharacterized protein LOC106336564 n=1 Tax=Brassica oleracea var. oleracea TaxID=109376 RepID=UPI0006A6B76E|nr:PREDICTED: uncharacterized protein LOC106336564 [Brassica oleracea var. oleracea]